MASSTRVCPICGKVFHAAVYHQYKKVWKRKTYTTCSYTCYEALEKAIEEEITHSKHARVNKLLDKDISDVL